MGDQALGQASGREGGLPRLPGRLQVDPGKILPNGVGMSPIAAAWPPSAISCDSAGRAARSGAQREHHAAGGHAAEQEAGMDTGMDRLKDFHRRSRQDRDNFWRELAGEVHWETPFEKVLDDSRPPFARWFVGGRT